jgi:AbrB family looped-hinge helix DNA binding protein
MQNLTSKITSKGQVTIPKEVRESMGLTPSDSVSFVVLEGGKALILARNRPITDVIGCLKDKPRGFKGILSLEEMEAVIDRERLKAGMAGLEK